MQSRPIFHFQRDLSARGVFVAALLFLVLGVLAYGAGDVSGALSSGVPFPRPLASYDDAGHVGVWAVLAHRAVADHSIW